MLGEGKNISFFTDFKILRAVDCWAMASVIKLNKKKDAESIANS